MIWIIVVAAVFVAGGVWFLANTTRTRVVVAVAALAAVGGYWVIGRPDMPDEPLAARLDAIDTLARTSADTLTGEQMMAIIQKRAQESPNDPEPHKYMGDLLAAAGAPNEAILAYQSALRRNPDFQPALKALADLLFRLSGRVDPSVRDLYLHAYQVDQSDLRVGYMAGVGEWQAGRRAEAEALWASIEAKTAEDDPRRQMFQAIRETFAVDTPPEGLAIPSGPPG